MQTSNAFNVVGIHLIYTDLFLGKTNTDGWAQCCGNFSDLAMELPQYCTTPLICIRIFTIPSHWNIRGQQDPCALKARTFSLCVTIIVAVDDLVISGARESLAYHWTHLLTLFPWEGLKINETKGFNDYHSKGSNGCCWKWFTLIHYSINLILYQISRIHKGCYKTKFLEIILLPVD